MEKQIGGCLELVIRFEAGSDFQFNHARSLLEGMGAATSEHLRNTHRKNWCYYSLELLDKNSVSKKIKELEEEGKRYSESYAQDK